MDNKALVEFLVALNKVQGLLDPVKKDSTNPHFQSQYASLAAVNDAIMGPLTENGFVIIQGGVDIGGKPYLRTELFHVGGHREQTDYPLVVSDSNPQHMASATTYARRYALCAMFNLSTEDDDGNAATSGATRTSASNEQRAPSGSLPTLKQATQEDASGVVKFIPSRVEYVDGQGKGAGKKFAKIYSPEGQVYDGAQFQGEMAEAAKTGNRNLVIQYERHGRFLNIVRNGTKIEVQPQEDLDSTPF